MDTKSLSRDRTGVELPMTCPLCDSVLQDGMVRDLGGVTAHLDWRLFAGYCPVHKCWFQAEVVARPPREIFPVNKPFGVARRLVVDGREYYSFPTIWNSLSPAERRSLKVDPLDWRYWQIARSTTG